MNLPLLEQAVIDASSLKEAAMKNAENLILEKYALELKEAVNSILEQDTDLLGLDGSTNGGMPPTEDPLAKNVPMAATDGDKLCPCPDEDQEIEINFNQLAQQMDQPQDGNPGLPGQSGELKPGDDDSMLEEAESGITVPAQLAPELHMYHMSMNDPVYKVGSLAYTGKPVPAELLQQAIDNLQGMIGKMGDPDEHQDLERLVSELQNILSTASQSNPEDESTMQRVPEGDYNQNLYEDVDLTEEVVNELLETLNVDMEPVPHGHVGKATSAERVDSDEIALARAQDDKVAEENKDLKKTLEKLQEYNKLLKEQVSSFKVDNNNIRGIALQASRKLQDINLENAKLIYMNRALRSNSLNERQRNTIVETISKVGSVNEAKVLYETVQKSNGVKRESKVPETITETLERNKGRSLPYQPTNISQQKTIDPIKERMQKIAGIKRIE